MIPSPLVSSLLWWTHSTTPSQTTKMTSKISGSAVKSPQRRAGLALQRTALMSPGGRVRSGSTDIRSVNLPSTDGEGPALVPSQIGGGRSRSGSMGGAMR
jgi:hypothetical protein